MNGNNRDDIKIDALVNVIQKQDQKTGKITQGKVKRILTNSKTHNRGIKVMLDNGIVGRVKDIIE